MKLPAHSLCTRYQPLQYNVTAKGLSPVRSRANDRGLVQTRDVYADEPRATFYAANSPFAGVSAAEIRALKLPERWNDMPHLSRHAAFFDPNGSGFVGVRQTYRGFRELGFGLSDSLVASVAIPWALGSKTGGSFWKGVRIDGIASGEHPNANGDGGRTGIFDRSGWVIEARFNQVWGETAKAHPNFLDAAELESMLQRISAEAPSEAEWSFLQKLASRIKMESMSKEMMQDLYNGKFFFRVRQDPDYYLRSANAAATAL